MSNSQLLLSTQNYHNGSSNERAYNEQHQHYQNTQSDRTKLVTPETAVPSRSRRETAVPSRSRSGKTKKGKEVATEHGAGYKKEWEEWEDQILATCWCNKTDTTVDTKNENYWSEICRMYNDDVLKCNGVPREVTSLKNRWHKYMRPQGQLYISCYKKIMANAKSGENEVKMLQRVKKEYDFISPKPKKKFIMGHVIDILIKCAKFCAVSTEGTYPVMDNVNLDHLSTPRSMHDSADTPDSDQISSRGSGSGKRKSSDESTTQEVREVNSPIRPGARPPGIKQRKTKAQRRLDGIAEGFEAVERDAKMRELEISLQETKVKCFYKNKDRQTILQILASNKEMAETPEEHAAVKRMHNLYMMQWAKEDNLDV